MWAAGGRQIDPHSRLVVRQTPNDFGPWPARPRWLVEASWAKLLDCAHNDDKGICGTIDVPSHCETCSADVTPMPGIEKKRIHRKSTNALQDVVIVTKSKPRLRWQRPSTPRHRCCSPNGSEKRAHQAVRTQLARAFHWRAETIQTHRSAAVWAECRPARGTRLKASASSADSP